MTLDPETRRSIRDEVKHAVNVILHAKFGETSNEYAELLEPLPGADKIPARPVVHPYGLVSRAPQGTLAVTARVGNHPAARIILGARDPERANMEFLNEGDVCLYNSDGTKIVLQGKKVKMGSENADNPAVLGNELITLLGQIIDLLILGNSVLTTTPGNPTVPNPAITPLLNALKAQYLTNPATNIVARNIMLERGSLV